jgi:CheY-like chemotaxis protein
MKKVVVAEASPTIKSVADSLLRQNGYDVVCTSDGLQAWEVISSEKPDLVLVGQGLSGISGLELCHQITADRITGGIPVVLMIGSKDPITEEQILASGARGRLRKPFSPKDLLDVAERLAGQGGGTLVKAPEPIDNMPRQQTKYNTQVSSTQHLHEKKEPYNLEWLDLNETNATKQISKVASFDLSAEDQSLVIDNDQYGLAHPQMLPEEHDDEQTQPEAVAQKDEDYEWFLGEIKAEMEGKSKFERQVKPEVSSTATPILSSESKPEAIKFDDLKPSEESHQTPNSLRQRQTPPLFGLDSSTKLKLQTGTKSETMGPPAVRTLSDDEVSLLADRIALRLAAHIAARIDKNQLIEAIRAVLR